VCDRSLVELKFNFDKGDNKVYCNEDYNKKHASICYTCKEPIVPKHGQKTVEKLCALDKHFHSDCFKCEVSSKSQDKFHAYSIVSGLSSLTEDQ